MAIFSVGFTVHVLMRSLSDARGYMLMFIYNVCVRVILHGSGRN